MSTSHDVPSVFGGGDGGRRSVSRSEQRVEFAPANTVRQMNPGEAVLLHGTLPPIHLEAVRWWKQTRPRRARPARRRRQPRPPADLPTCPLTPKQPGERTPVIDEETLTATLAELPAPKKRRTTDTTKQSAAKADELPFTAGHQPVRQRSSCMYCGLVLLPGDGQRLEHGGGEITTCYPPCPSARSSLAEQPAPAPADTDARSNP